MRVCVQVCFLWPMQMLTHFSHFSMTCTPLCAEGRCGCPYTHRSAHIHAASVCHHMRTNTFDSNRHASLRPPLSAQQIFPVKNILSTSGHIAPLCHFNYGHKALSCESIIVREIIEYHGMIGLDTKTSVGLQNIMQVIS